jgi:hypothetical protein
MDLSLNSNKGWPSLKLNETSINSNLVILTPDLESSHTLKRAKEFIYYFKISILGLERNGYQKYAEFPEEITLQSVGKTEHGKYWKRLTLYLQLFKRIKNHRPSIIWARGTDMLFLALCYKNLIKRDIIIFSEITDIYEISFKGFFSSVFHRIEILLFQLPDMVFATSPAFFDFNQVPEELQFLWENQISFSYNHDDLQLSLQTKIGIFNKQNGFNLIQSGYLRCKKTIDGLTEIVCSRNSQAYFHMYGFSNGGEFSNNDLYDLVKTSNGKVLFHGSYVFPRDLGRIFCKAHFTIVSEFSPTNLNSTLNLTNRIYESISNYTPCIAIGKGAVYEYVKINKLGWVFINFKEFKEFLQNLTIEEYSKMYLSIQFKEFWLKQETQHNAVHDFLKQYAQKTK